MTTICVDAMGGDERPEVVLEGIARALEADSDLEVLVAGNEEVVQPFCASHTKARALVTTEVIGMGEHPAEAVRTKTDSSIVRACEAVRAGEADGFFSAGSTGAMLVASTLKVGRIKGVKRPAIAVAFPAAAGREKVVLDLGANADCRPEVIVQFARMGAVYAHVALGIENARVALLSNGSEDTKGSETVIAYHEALAAADCGFVGNCEGNDLLMGDFDVIVCDGFTGNIALKTIEGTAKYLIGRLRNAANESKRYLLGAGLLKPAVKDIAKDLSGDAHGGAILLGLKAPVLIGHGATSATAVMNGTLATAAAVRNGLVERIAAYIAS